MYGDVFSNKEPASSPPLVGLDGCPGESAFVFGLSPDSDSHHLDCIAPSRTSSQVSQLISSIQANASATDEGDEIASEYSHDGGNTASVLGAETASINNDIEPISHVCWSIDDENVEWSPWTRHQVSSLEHSSSKP